jgi:hypothetical protein
VIHCCRFAAGLGERGLRVFLHVPAALVRLLRTLPGVAGVMGPGEALPNLDAHAPVMSLPRLCGMRRLDDALASIPYLSADAALAEACREKVRGGARLVVGVAWRGNPQHAGDRVRAVPTKQFAGLGRVPGVRLVNLMKGAAPEEVEAAGAAEVGSDQWTDFADTAAAVVNLDLVVTVDTAVAHLAGALGVPTWMALPSAPDWRWGLGREDSPWYPTVRLFRQEQRGEWDPVFARIAEELARRAGADP